MGGDGSRVSGANVTDGRDVESCINVSLLYPDCDRSRSVIDVGVYVDVTSAERDCGGLGVPPLQ